MLYTLLFVVQQQNIYQSRIHSLHFRVFALFMMFHDTKLKKNQTMYTLELTLPHSGGWKQESGSLTAIVASSLAFVFLSKFSPKRINNELSVLFPQNNHCLSHLRSPSLAPCLFCKEIVIIWSSFLYSYCAVTAPVTVFCHFIFHLLSCREKRVILMHRDVLSVASWKASNCTGDYDGEVWGKFLLTIYPIESKKTLW